MAFALTHHCFRTFHNGNEINLPAIDFYELPYTWSPDYTGEGGNSMQLYALEVDRIVSLQNLTYPIPSDYLNSIGNALASVINGYISNYAYAEGHTHPRVIFDPSLLQMPEGEGFDGEAVDPTALMGELLTACGYEMPNNFLSDFEETFSEYISPVRGYGEYQMANPEEIFLFGASQGKTYTISAGGYYVGTEGTPQGLLDINYQCSGNGIGFHVTFQGKTAVCQPYVPLV